MDVAVRAHLCGWKFIFLNDVKCPCELPESYEAAISLALGTNVVVSFLNLGNSLRPNKFHLRSLQGYSWRLKRYNPVLQSVITFTEELAYKQAKEADHLLSRGVYLAYTDDEDHPAHDLLLLRINLYLLDWLGYEIRADKEDHQAIVDCRIAGSTQSPLKAQDDDILISSNHVTGSLLLEHNWKLEEVTSYHFKMKVLLRSTNIVCKRQSLGSGLDQKRRLSCGSDSENETVQGFSSGRSHGGISSAISGCDKEPEATCSASLHVSSGMANDESVF
ncbi:hypothetical protein POM88_051279 [Heracleum sosnowskyi]|uniref:Uncharacterized protein n=1 Tax=Heracleum sosnowskyi TaxID=360622 RepID=A0AAD8M3K5_9APIA|nr:hypothetical protein POM88_051279 [Heracleum sosnowskyi]